MKYLYLILFSCIIFSTQAQQGFNKIYAIGSGGNGIGNIIYTQDTIFALGVSFSEAPHVQEIFFAKMDTLGEILDIQYYRDSLDRDLVYGTSPNGFIKLSDNSGYLFRGFILQTSNGIISKIDNDGNLIYRKEIETENSMFTDIRDIIELPDGYLLTGIKVFIDFQPAIFVIKTNHNGDILWETNYTSGSNRPFFYSSVYTLNNNEYVISSSTTSPSNTLTQDIKNTSRIFAIDSLGNKKWEWESEESLDELGAGVLFLTGEGHWGYSSAKGIFVYEFNDIDHLPSIVIRDSVTFEKLDERIFYPSHSGRVNYFSNVISLNDDKVLAIGTMLGYLPIEPDYDGNVLFGVMYKTNFALDSVWSRRDTATWNINGGSINYPLSVLQITGIHN